MNISNNNIFSSALSTSKSNDKLFNFQEGEIIYTFNIFSYKFTDMRVVKADKESIYITDNKTDDKIYSIILFNEIKIKSNDIFQYEKILFSYNKEELKKAVMQYLSGLIDALVSELRICVERSKIYHKKISRIMKVAITQCGTTTIDNDEEFIEIYNRFHHYVGKYIVPLIYRDNSTTINVEATMENCKKYNFFTEIETAIRNFIEVAPSNKFFSKVKYHYLIGNAAASNYYNNLDHIIDDEELLNNLINFKNNNYA